MDWFDEAPCRGADPRIFFPDVSNSVGTKNHRHSRHLIANLEPARAICRECPFMDQECLRYAMAYPYLANEVQIIAGRTPREIAEYRDAHGIPAPTASFRLAEVEETVRLYNRAVERGSSRPMLEVSEILDIDDRSTRRRIREARRRGVHIAEVTPSWATRLKEPASG